MAPTIVHRRTGAQQAPAIAELVRESGAYYAALAPAHFARIEPQGLEEWIAGDDEWLVDPANLALLADVDGEIAGYLEATIRLAAADARYNGNRDAREPHLFINALVTAERHKRQGVGTLLVEAAEAWAVEQGVTLALCDTYLGSPQSLPFWESRMGYERRSVRLRKRLERPG